MAITYNRTLGLFSGTMAVVGGIIGSGIFVNPQIVAQRVVTAPLTLGVWALGGAVALIGAFCFAELGWRRPRAGGGYVYLREGFGTLPAFLYAWALLLAVSTGAIAAVAVTFANYAVALLGLGPATRLPLATLAIALLTLVNYLGVRPGAITGNVFTVLKLLALAGLIVVGLSAQPAAAPAEVAVAPSNLSLAFAAALVPVLFAYGGWQQTNYIAEEIIDPEKNLPRALVLGVVIVVTVYLLANESYLRLLGPAGLAASQAPAAQGMEAALGPWGGRFIAAGVVASTFGFLNLVILVTPRVYQAMAADGLFFPSFARLHPKHRTPAVATLVQGAWAVVLLFSGTYGDLLDWVVFCDWIFFGLAAAALFRLRRLDREGGRPEPPAGVRVPGWPVTPLVFIAASLYVVFGSVSSNPRNAALGTALLLAGVPVHAYWRRRGRRDILA